MSGYDELATHRARLTAAASPPGERDVHSAAVADMAAAARDRLLAAADRQRAAAALAGAYRDDLTGTLNRRPGRERMESEIDRARRVSTPLAVIFFDIVGLKLVNDSRGHRRGDELLAAAGTAQRSTFRSYDVVMRYGGDEFVCALPGGTAETAVDTFARVRRALDELMPGARLRAGHSQLLPTDTLDHVVHRADMALYGRSMYGRGRAYAFVSGMERPMGIALGLEPPPLSWEPQRPGLDRERPVASERDAEAMRR